MATADPQDIQTIALTIMTYQGEQITFQVATGETILKIKYRLFLAKDSLPVERQMIMFLGKQLEDSAMLKDLGLQENSVLQVLLKDGAAGSSLIQNDGDFDVVVKNNFSYFRTKDAMGMDKLIQFGVQNSDGSKEFVFQDRSVPSYTQLLQEGRLAILPRGDQVGKLTLQSHPGQALCLKHHVDEFMAHDVHWVELGPENRALWVYIVHNPFGDFIKLAHKSNHQFDCSFGKYHAENKIPIYHCHNGGNQWFVVNPDLTISPTHSPHMVWAWTGSDLVLRKRGSKGQLVFKELEPSYQPEEGYMKLTLQSHPGKGIVFNGKERQHGHGQEEFIQVGSAEKAITVFQDEFGFIHSKARPAQTFDGYEHTKRDLEFFTMHSEYKHQKFTINQDGTISLNKDPSYVLGTDSSGHRVKFVKRGNEHQFVFGEAMNYLVGATPGKEGGKGAGKGAGGGGTYVPDDECETPVGGKDECAIF